MGVQWRDLCFCLRKNNINNKEEEIQQNTKAIGIKSPNCYNKKKLGNKHAKKEKVLKQAQCLKDYTKEEQARFQPNRNTIVRSEINKGIRERQVKILICYLLIQKKGL